MELPMSMSAKALLLNEMLTQKVKPVSLTRRMGTTAQEINCLVNLHHKAKIDTLALALHSLEKV